MKLKIGLIIVLIGFHFSSTEAGLIIKNITVIDAENALRTNQTIYIEDGVIQSINSSKKSDHQSNDLNNSIIDGNGKF